MPRRRAVRPGATGRSPRHVVAPGERLADLAADAGRRALERAGADADELDLVLVATTTADELLPNAAPLVANALGDRAAYDRATSDLLREREAAAV